MLIYQSSSREKWVTFARCVKHFLASHLPLHDAYLISRTMHHEIIYNIYVIIYNIHVVQTFLCLYVAKIYHPDVDHKFPSRYTEMSRKCLTQSKIPPTMTSLRWFYIYTYICINWLQLSAIRVMREKDTCTMCIWEDEKHWKLQQTVIFNKSNDIQRPIAVLLTVFCNNKLWFSLRYWYNVVVQGHVYNSCVYNSLWKSRC